MSHVTTMSICSAWQLWVFRLASTSTSTRQPASWRGRLTWTMLTSIWTTTTSSPRRSVSYLKQLPADLQQLWFRRPMSAAASRPTPRRAPTRKRKSRTPLHFNHSNHAGIIGICPFSLSWNWNSWCCPKVLTNLVFVVLPKGRFYYSHKQSQATKLLLFFFDYTVLSDVNNNKHARDESSCLFAGRWWRWRWSACIYELVCSAGPG